MICSSFTPNFETSVHIPDQSGRLPQPQIAITRKPSSVSCSNHNVTLNLLAKMPEPNLLHKSLLPFAASVAILLCSGPAQAGFLSGITGLESVPGPQLPSIDFLNRFNDENQKKYAENDARFKESPILKKLLEQSKVNKEKNKQAVLDKYCFRGAEWGVGDCSAEGMSPEDKEKFIAMLKQKAGVEE